jgi:prepilin-type N-terminal cleavage/methylation domain-containing protein
VREDGFTLVELMTVVGIVGILAVLAYTGYRKYVVREHLTEATNVLSGIKMQQERYKAEVGTYLDVSASLAANNASTAATAYPHCVTNVTPGAYSIGWGGDLSAPACPASCCNAGSSWSKLRVETNAPTFYGYSTIAGAAGSALSSYSGQAPSVTINGVAPLPASSLGPWFVATALGDPDGNGVFSTEMISSFDNKVWIDNEGE